MVREFAANVVERACFLFNFPLLGHRRILTLFRIEGASDNISQPSGRDVRNSGVDEPPPVGVWLPVPILEEPPAMDVDVGQCDARTVTLPEESEVG